MMLSRRLAFGRPQPVGGARGQPRPAQSIADLMYLERDRLDGPTTLPSQGAHPAICAASGSTAAAQVSGTIFLHSSFRISGTWFWSRFRASPQVLTYYEVFNEQLSSLSKEELETKRHDAWYSKHPPVGSYFLEYLPLIQDGCGIADFDQTMSFDRFIPTKGVHGPLSDAERHYLGRLITHALDLGKIPLLSAKRSLGRLHAIKAAFPGVHILLYRNLFQQWLSYAEQLLRDNAYFLFTICAIIRANQHDDFIRLLHQRFELNKPISDSNTYLFCFLLLHLYLYAQVADAADLIIDLSRVASDDKHRKVIQRRVAAMCAVEIDLSDVRATPSSLVVSRGELPADIRDLSNSIISRAPSRLGRALASKALRDFVRGYVKGPCDSIAATTKPACLSCRPPFSAQNIANAIDRPGDEGEKARLDVRLARAEVTRLSAELGHVSAELSGVYQSRSWRITKPLRAIEVLWHKYCF